MVFASIPMASPIRLAARPVGAASSTVFPDKVNRSMIAFIVVVLPVPGSPVITQNFDETARRIASTYTSSYRIADFFCKSARALSKSSIAFEFAVAIISLIRRTVPTSE